MKRVIEVFGIVLLAVLALVYLIALIATPVLWVLLWWAWAYEWDHARLIACLTVTAFVVAAVGFMIGDEW